MSSLQWHKNFKLAQQWFDDFWHSSEMVGVNSTEVHDIMEGNQTAITVYHPPYTCSNDLTVGQYHFYVVFSWWSETVGALCLDSVGIILNIISIIIFASRKMRGCLFNQLLICLAIFDTTYLICGILEAFRRHLAPSSLHQILFVNVFYPARSIMLFCSIYTTLSLTLEQYNAVLRPHLYRDRERRRTWRNLLYYIGPVVLVASVYYTPKFFDIKLKEAVTCSDGTHLDIQYLTNTSLENLRGGKVENCNKTLAMYASDLRKNPLYVLLYINISNLIMTCIIPIVMLVYLNFRIYRSLSTFLQRHASTNSSSSRSHQNPDKKQIAILFAIVIRFAICHTLRIVLNVDEMVHLEQDSEEREIGCQSTRFWTVVAAIISELLLQLNASINFILYCCLNGNFREEGRSLASALITFFQERYTWYLGPPHTTNRENDVSPNNIELQAMNAQGDV